MSDNRFQPWQVSYEGKSTQQLTVTAPTALDAVKDFALQRPNSGADCVVKVKSPTSGGTVQSFVRERGVWRRKEELLTATAPVRPSKSIRLTRAQVGLTVALVLGLLGVMAWTNPSERDHRERLHDWNPAATIHMAEWNNTIRAGAGMVTTDFRILYRDYLFFSTLHADHLKQATTLGVLGKVLVVKDWRWRERIPPDSPHADTSPLRSADNQLVTVQGNVPPDTRFRQFYAQVTTFQIGQYELTWQEWQNVREWAVANGYSGLDGVGAGSAGNHPVRNVGWTDAMAWCNAKSEQEGLSPVYYREVTETFAGDKRVYDEIHRGGKVGFIGAGTRVVIKVDTSAGGYRLPTSAEWEWAARGGHKCKHSLQPYSGSNNLDEVAWWRKTSGGAPVDLEGGRGTWPVGEKVANELGLHDMSGNVSEMCTHAVLNNIARTEKVGGVMDVSSLGGSWNSVDDACRVNGMGGYNHTDRGSATTGLRLARNAP
jgi:formylglycine-generating enzyme